MGRTVILFQAPPPPNAPASGFPTRRATSRPRPAISFLSRKRQTEIEAAVVGFLTGDLTLAQIEGPTAEDLYQVADLGYDLAAEGKLEDARGIPEGLYCYNPFDAYFHAALGSMEMARGQETGTRDSGRFRNVDFSQ